MSTSGFWGLPYMAVRLIYLALVISYTPAFAADPVREPEWAAPQAVLVSFIEGEFNGVPDMRMARTAFRKRDPRGHESLFDPTVSNGGVISLVADPVVIVSKYVINDLVVNGNKASATVTYDVAAKTRGYGLPGRTICINQIRSETVHYFLRQSKGMWLLLDPVIPRVSIESMVKQYYGEIQAMANVIADPRASRAQKRAYDTLQEEFEKLQSLQRE